MKPSSVIALTRGGGSELEVFWSQRRFEMAFLGGFWAFAGGSVEPSDEALPLRGDIPEGFPFRQFYGCAARETFEEMGLLATTSGLRHVSRDPALADLRTRLHSGENFAALLAEHGLEVDADRFLPIGKWQTPEWFDIPFDSEFFALALTPEEDASFGAAIAEHLLEAELLAGEWTSPERALTAWHRAERYMTLPIRLHLQAFAAADVASDVDVHSLDVPFHYAEWVMVPGIYIVPLKSPTIPPATHTNCIMVGEQRFIVIDPGSPYQREKEGLATLIQQMLDDGRTLEAIVLTHHHVDHISGVEDLVARFGCEVWAHTRTAELVDFPVARLLADGEVIELAEDSLRCVFTPGHASGHLCFHHDRSNAVICGDLIASTGTILVNPPDGHMGDYLASLDRIRDLAPGALIPAHGWVVTNPLERLQFYRSHRLAREDKILEALTRLNKPATAEDVVPDAYSDAPPAVWPIAARSAEAHLIHLVEIGAVSKNDDGEYIARGTR